MWDGFLSDTVQPLADPELQRFANKRILITGAGGFLGSALARQLCRLPVGRLVLLDVAEYGLYRLEEDLQTSQQRAKSTLVVGSVQDEALLSELFAEHAPEIIFHAAALKHVPLMESNALAAAETNVIGTQVLLKEAAKRQVESLVFLSTDKAVDPISIMGATKRIAEQMALSTRRQGRNINVVRLPNVLGSTGSVAPRFARQISRGGPVTVTHPEATRYFLSKTSAVRHLLRSATNRTQTGLTVPAVGAPFRVEDLARIMMDRAGDGKHDLRIVHTGLRIADKLHEQLVSPAESVEVVPGNPATLEISSHFDPQKLDEALAEIRWAVDTRDRYRLMLAIQHAVPEYLQSRDKLSHASGEGA